MSKILIINGHQPYPFASGKLNYSEAPNAEGHW